MKLSSIALLLLSLLLAACSSVPERPLPDMGNAKVSIPESYTRLCDPLPKFENRDYSDAELKVVLNTWITVHEQCAGKFKTLSAFVLKMYGTPSSASVPK